MGTVTGSFEMKIIVLQFLDGLLDQEIKVEYLKEPKDVDEAVYHVLHLIQTRNGCRYNRRNRNS